MRCSAPFGLYEDFGIGNDAGRFRPDGIGVGTDHNGNLGCAAGADGMENVRKHRAAADAMQHLRA
jgi:hypothetical protein